LEKLDKILFKSHFFQALNKKDHKGGPGGSPGDDDLCGDSDTELESNLTPGTEAKYNKIDEEFQLIMQHRNNNANGNRVCTLIVGLNECLLCIFTALKVKMLF